MEAGLAKIALISLIILVAGIIIGVRLGATSTSSTIRLIEIKTLTETERYPQTTTITMTQTSERPITIIETWTVNKTFTVTVWMTETRTIESWETVTLGCESGYPIISYWTVREEFYSGDKVPIRDSSGKFLGYYKQDFIDDVMVEGWGKGDGIRNDGSYLGYDPELGFIKSPEPLDAYGSPLVPWRTVAAPPHIRNGTIILIVGFRDYEEISKDVVDKLLNSRFVVSDRGPSIVGHHIDISVGEQYMADMNESPYALYIQNATICFLLG